MFTTTPSNLNMTKVKRNGHDEAKGVDEIFNNEGIDPFDSLARFPNLKTKSLLA